AVLLLRAELRQKGQELQQARAEAAQAGARPDATLEAKVALLQKQIAVQQKMLQLLVEQIKKKKAESPEVDTLTGKVATLEARLTQRAHRHQALSQAIDTLAEQMDAQERNAPRLPAALKELFLSSRTNETPLSIYGSFIERYQQAAGHASGLSTPDFAP